MLWRYLVKSMQGEEVDRATVTERGLLGDRAYAILDREAGTVASAKHPRKWARLFACHATYSTPPQTGSPLPHLWITLPDGTNVSNDDPEIDQALSRALGRDVELIAVAPPSAMREANRTPLDHPQSEEIIRREALALAAPGGTFFDYAPLHLLTTASLGRFQQAYPGGRLEVRRFRPNVVVAPPAGVSGFAENAWIGKQLTLGESVRLHVIDPTPRCVVVTLPQEGLPADTGILRTVTQQNSAASATLAPGVVFPAVCGVYATVLRGGPIHRHQGAWVS